MSEKGNTYNNECCVTDVTHAENIFSKLQSKINLLPEEKQGKIHLLKIKDVVLWIFGITTFLEPENPIVSYRQKKIEVETDEVYKSGKRKGKTKKEIDDIERPVYKYKVGAFNKQLEQNEAEWNMKIMKEIRPDLFEKGFKQKSKFGLFGEILVKEYYLLINEYNTDRPEKKGGHNLDLETIKEMIEVKTGSYFTTGTAGEKIYGVPWKYADVPRLYNKPLLIVLLGGDKKESELVCESEKPEREEMKKYWESKNITFICFRKLLNNL